MGGFGSAVLETAADLGLDTSRIRRLGIPDQFIEHGERAELLADLQLDAPGIAQACRDMAQRVDSLQLTSRTRSSRHAWNPPAMNDPQTDRARATRRACRPGVRSSDRRLRVLLLGNGQRPHVQAEADRLRPVIEAARGDRAE